MARESLFVNKLDRLYFSRPIKFIKYVDAFNQPPSILEGAMMVPMFKWELEEDPNKLGSFFEHYGLFVQQVLNIKPERVADLITAQHLGGFSVLADYDKTGETTIKSMEEGPVIGDNLDRSLVGLYELTLNYGPTMNIFSDFIGVRGGRLATILLGKRPVTNQQRN